MNGLVVFLLLLTAYLGVIYVLQRRGAVGSDRVQLAGPLLLLKTQAGKKTIDRIAQWRRPWLLFADIGIWVTWITGLLVFGLLLMQLYQFVTRPVETAANSPSPQFLIGLPGVNPLIPVGYGIFALVVALVIHEGCHGILARAQDLKVKSLGLLLFVVPVGAFVEPDEKDLERASARAKNRVFAAGPMSNIVLAVITAVLFSTALMGSATIVNGGDGVGITSTVPELSAARAGLAPGDVVVAINGIPIHDLGEFNRVMNATRAGEKVAIEYVRDGARATATATLDDKYAYVERVSPQANQASFKNKGFLGVGTAPLDPEPCTTLVCIPPMLTVGGLIGALQSPLSGLDHFAAFISYPFFVLGGIDVFQAPYASFVEFNSPLYAWSPDAFIIVANSLYWLFWLNLMLGTFNALPAGPLDGGQMLRTTLREFLLKRYRVDRSRMVVELEPGRVVQLDNLAQETGTAMGPLVLKGADLETQEKLDRIQVVVKRTTMSLGLFILAMLLLPIFGRPLVGLLFG